MSGGAVQLLMNTRAKWYIAAVAAGAIATSAALYLNDPSIPERAVQTVLLLSLLALVAEALAVLLPNMAMGSIGFIPFLASALIVPNWTALIGVVAVRLTMELVSRRTAIKATFNVSVQALTFAAAVLVYVLLGGRSLASFEDVPLTTITIATGLPAIVAFVASFAVNSTLVSGVIAANSNRPLAEVWRGTFLSTIGLDLLASPLVFLFAWVYVSFGPYAAAALWIPVLGLRQLHKSNLDLEQTNSELLELMVKSMEARDPYTSGHSRRVQQFSIAIARAFGLPPSEVERVGRAALLHDVGKIHEKYAPILRKPGKLSPDEWQTMQKHPADGAELISTMSRLHDIVPAVRHHHERWDGTGYPDGLAGEMIPLISRIITFADTIDAMTSERPYRRTMSEDEVRSEIVRCRGSQFDPTITDRILSGALWRLLFTPTAVQSPPHSGVVPIALRSRGDTVKQA